MNNWSDWLRAEDAARGQTALERSIAVTDDAPHPWATRDGRRITKALYNVRSRDIEEFVAPFEIWSTEVLCGESLGLEPRPCRSIKYDDPVADGVEVVAHDAPATTLQQGSSIRPITAPLISKRSGASSGYRSVTLIDQALAPNSSVAAVSQGLSLHRSG